MISAGRTGLLSIICVALREASMVLPPPLAAPPVTGALLKLDMLSSHGLLNHQSSKIQGFVGFVTWIYEYLLLERWSRAWHPRCAQVLRKHFAKPAKMVLLQVRCNKLVIYLMFRVLFKSKWFFGFVLNYKNLVVPMHKSNNVGSVCGVHGGRLNHQPNIICSMPRHFNITNEEHANHT